MQDILNTDKDQEKGFTYIKMEPTTQENIKIIKKMGKENQSKVMVINMKDNGKMM